MDLHIWVGMDAHYMSRGSADGVFAPVCRAAKVTELCSGAHCGKSSYSADVGLCILNPTGMYFERHVEHDEDYRSPGTWHFLEHCAH